MKKTNEKFFKAFGEMFDKIVNEQFPLLPEPNWPQDIAYIAFVIDNLVAQVEELEGVKN